MRLTVYGVPAPQGSLRAFHRPGMRHPALTSDNKRTKPWRQAIVDAARELCAGQLPLDCPVSLDVVFYLPRPASLPKRVQDPAKKPDLDKLLRACCDALTAAGVWKDDARLVRVQARKAFAAGAADPQRGAGVPRAEIEVVPA